MWETKYVGILVLLKRKYIYDENVFFNDVLFPIMKACVLTKSIMKTFH
jgi:hypothetical protein